MLSLPSFQITKFKTIPVNEYRLLFEDDVCFKYSGGKQIPKGRIDITTSPTFNLLAGESFIQREGVLIQFTFLHFQRLGTSIWRS